MLLIDDSDSNLIACENCSFGYIHFLLHAGTWKSNCGNLIKNLTNADLDSFLECFIHKERIAKSHGSQCGFCTPGIVMSMYTLLRNNPVPTNVEMESAFEGMVCLYSTNGLFDTRLICLP